jgi:hypothetical protein
LSKAADIIQKRNSRTPAQKPVKKIGKRRAEYIQCAANGLNLDANPRKAGEVYLWGPNGGSPQQWHLSDAGNGEYYIRSASNGLYLTGMDDASVSLLPYTSQTERIAKYGPLRHRQKWSLRAVPGEKGSLGSGLYYIHGYVGYLQLNPATKGNGAQVIGHWKDTGSVLLRWRFSPAGGSPNVH